MQCKCMRKRLVSEGRYVVVHKGKHYVGGTTSGCDFLRKEGTHIPYNFIGHLAVKSGVVAKHDAPIMIFADIQITSI